VSLGERVVGWTLRARWVVLPLLVVATVVLGWGATKVGVDNAVEVWFVEDNPSLLAYHRFQEVFGNDEVVAIAVHREEGILTREGMDTLRAVGAAAEGVEGVASVISLATVEDLRSTTDADGIDVLEVGKLTRWEPDYATLRERVLADGMLRGRLISADGKTALVVAQMATMEGFDQRRDGVLANLRAAVDPVLGADHRTAGIGVIYAALNQLSTVDSAVFVIVSYLLIVGVLWVLMGRIAAMAVAMLSVGAAAVWLMGAYGFAGRDINMVTMILPTLVLIIGISDCVHVMNHVAELGVGWQGSREALIRKAAGFVFMPCLFNTVTTVVGFASLATAPMAVLRDLGIFAAVGLSAAFVVCFAVCPVALLASRVEPRLSNTGSIQRLVDACAELALTRPALVLVGTAFVTLVSALGISRIVADTYSIDYLRTSHKVRQDSAWIEEHLGSYTPLEFVVRAENVQDPGVLAAIDRWERAMEASGDVGWAVSVADVAKRLNRELSADHADQVPDNADALAQAFLLYTSSPEVDLSRQVEGDWKAARVTVGIPMMSAGEMGGLIRRMEGLATWPAGVTVEVTGYLPLYVQMMKYVVQSQLSSFGSAFVVIFALIALAFRSVRLAALAVPANLVPMLLSLGVMGWAGIRLDVATVTIGAVVLGLVVDDTVQFLYRFQYELDRCGDPRMACRATVHSVGRSLVITALVLALGFSVLALAAIKSIAYFGLLVALALGTGVFGDLLVLPAMLALLPASLMPKARGVLAEATSP
jgi:predicted RND superfamily exporter protein